MSVYAKNLIHTVQVHEDSCGAAIYSDVLKHNIAVLCFSVYATLFYLLDYNNDRFNQLHFVYICFAHYVLQIKKTSVYKMVQFVLLYCIRRGLILHNQCLTLLYYLCIFHLADNIFNNINLRNYNFYYL